MLVLILQVNCDITTNSSQLELVIAWYLSSVALIPLSLQL